MRDSTQGVPGRAEVLPDLADPPGGEADAAKAGPGQPGWRVLSLIAGNAGKKKKRVNAFEQRAQAIHAAKHAPDPTTHSPDDSHAPDEAKPPRDGKVTAPACSPDFILFAPEKFLNTAAVSSPRDESGRKGASLSCKWICTGCGCVDTEESWGICPICYWPGPEPDSYVRTHTRWSDEL